MKKFLYNTFLKHKSRKFTWFMILLSWSLFIVHSYTHIAIPLNELMYAVMFVVGAYTGVDQFAAVMATRKLPTGQKYTGNSDKLYAICFGIVILLFIALTLSYLNPEIEYPLDLVLLAVGVILGAYVGGEKGKNAFENGNEPTNTTEVKKNYDETIEDLR